MRLLTKQSTGNLQHTGQPLKWPYRNKLGNLTFLSLWINCDNKICNLTTSIINRLVSGETNQLRIRLYGQRRLLLLSRRNSSLVVSKHIITYLWVFWSDLICSDSNINSIIVSLPWCIGTHQKTLKSLCTISVCLDLASIYGVMIRIITTKAPAISVTVTWKVHGNYIWDHF